MKSKKTFSAKSFIMILFGNLLMAAAAHLFLEPSGLVTGGVMGIALALNYANGMRVSIYAFILNSVCFVLGWVLLGKRYALSTLISSVSYPVFVALFESILPNAVLSTDMMLNAIFAGLLTGAALGIIIRTGSSSGGADCIPLALNKYFGTSVSAFVYILDFAILSAQIIVYPIESLLYGLVNVMIYSIVIDRILLYGDSRTEVKIISGKNEEIRRKILQELDRGVTMLHAEGGYSGNETSVVLTVVSNRKLQKLRRMVEETDQNALMIISRVSQVTGRGFTKEREYK